MPGVSSMQPVSGMDGIGKIYLKFKPKPKPKFPFGALLFLLTASAYFLVYLHSVTWTRHAFVIPFLRTIIGSYGFIGSLILPSEIFMEGPSSSVHIFKNIDGVHHVSAESIDDAMFGQGYLHAWNHLYALEMRRRAARGRLAEVEGYQSVQSDRVARVLDFEAMAKKDVSAESEENQRLLHNFAKGINAFITSRRFPSLSLLILGIVSVEEWTPEDTMMLLRLDAFTSSLAIQRSILNMTLHIGVTPEAAAEMLHVLGGHDLSTVVSRDVTKEMSLKSSFETAWAYIRPSGGAPIFATSLSSLDGSLNQWYINDISVASSFHVVGATRPGIPFVQHGHNKNVAWTLLTADDSSQHHLHEEVYRQRNASADIEILVEETSLGQIKKLDNCMIEAKESSTSAETCDGLDTGDKLCPESTAGSMTSVWCPIKLHTEIIDVRGSDLPTIESVKKSHRGPIVTSVLLSADARFKDRMVTLESPLLEKRFSIQFLKDLNRASDYNSVVEATSNGFAGTSRILYATKEKMGYIDIAAVSGPNTVVAVDSGIIVSSRDNALNERVTQLLKDSSNGSPVLEINHDIQCDSMPLDAQWFASFVLEILLKPRKELKEPTDEDINARNVAVTMLSNFINNADNVSAPVFIEALITAFKRIILSPLQRDPELFVHFYRKKEYATVKGSQTYKHLWTSDSFWLFRLLKSTQSSASPSWWVNDAGGLDALTLKAVAESIRTTDKYFGENHLAWDWHRLHGSFLTRSVRFPFSPSGVDFAKGLIAGPYFLPGSTNSIFQNGYDANIEITPKYGHPLSSRECMRSTFRMSIDMSNVDDVDIISGPGHSSEVENYGYTSTANMWARCESIKLSWSKQREPNSSSDVIIHPRR